MLDIKFLRTNPDVVKENLQIIFADKIDDVLQVALVNNGSNNVSIQN